MRRASPRRIGPKIRGAVPPLRGPDGPGGRRSAVDARRRPWCGWGWPACWPVHRRRVIRMKLFALSDLHVGYAENRCAIERMTPRPNDWLILAGDLGETEQHLLYVLDTLGPRFKQL